MTCQNVGGNLAVIRSQDENNFTLDLVIKQERVTVLGAWLGLYKNPSAGDEFHSIDGTPLADQYSAWAHGEPSQVGASEMWPHVCSLRQNSEVECH